MVKTYLIGEIGINHNGDINLAKKIIVQAKKAGFDSVKFQKRNPEISTPPEKKNEKVQINNTEKKVGRNEKCPCGSGKKFKHCHGNI